MAPEISSQTPQSTDSSSTAGAAKPDPIAPASSNAAQVVAEAVAAPAAGAESSDARSPAATTNVRTVPKQAGLAATPAEPKPVAPPIDPVAIAVGSLTGFVQAILSPFGAGAPVAPPDPPTPLALLAWARRELFNQSPTAPKTEDVSVADLGSNGTITGSIGAIDPDGDGLVYTVVRGPSLGRLVLDRTTGNYTYTPVVDLGLLGGTDTFTVQASDATNLHLHGLVGLLTTPFAIFKQIPFIGSIITSTLEPLGFWPTDPHTATTVVDIAVKGSDPEATSSFPVDFHWGVASSGFQYEGGNPALPGMVIDTNSDWYQWTHDPLNQVLGLLSGGGGKPENGPGGYVKYADDARQAHDELGVDTFRMGIDWSRIFPHKTKVLTDGTTISMDDVDVSDGIDAAEMATLDQLADPVAVQHYHDVFASLRANKLEPFVTLQHSTLPTWIHNGPASRIVESLGGSLQDGGGWYDDSTVAEFEKYAAYAAAQYGHDVDRWATENEPVSVYVQYMPLIPVLASYQGPLWPRADLTAKALQNESVAHARAYDLIHQFDVTGDNQVGFTLSMFPFSPADPTNPVDVDAATSFSNFYNRWFPDAVLNGEMDSDFNGVITPNEVHPDMVGKADFIGVQYYGQGIVSGFGYSPYPAMPMIKGYPQFAYIAASLAHRCPAAECSDVGIKVSPSGLRDMLDIANSYGKPIWITENGIDTVDADHRTSYLVRHLAVIQRAIAEGMDIRGYLQWSNVDNLEWSSGFTAHYGLYHYDPTTLERIPTSTVPIFKDIVANGISGALWQDWGTFV